MALSITVHGQGTFTASMEEGPVTFTAAIASVGPQGATGATGATGVVAATAPITYNSGTQTVGIDDFPTFTGVIFGAAGQGIIDQNGITFPSDSSVQTTAFIGEARKEYIVARNSTGTTIGAGKVVYLSGATGNKPTVALALADSETTSARTIGVTAEAIANNADGKVISGAVENIDTSAFTAGDTLYLSATTAGGYTTSLPAAPLHGVVIGIVTRSNPSVGSIEVAIQNYQELKELSDVNVSDRANNDGLFWESSSSTWRSKTIAEVLGYTPANGTDYLAKANNLSDLASASTARTNLGLGTMAVETASNYLTTSAAATTYYPIPTGTTSQYLRGNGSLSTFSTDVIAAVPAASTTTAGVVELATDAEAIAGTSTTLAVTPSNLIPFSNRTNQNSYLSNAFSAVTSGTGSVTSQALNSKTVSAPTSVAGYAALINGWQLATLGGSANSGFIWNQKVNFVCRYNRQLGTTDANSLFRILVGRSTTGYAAAGDLAARGIGVRCVNGSAMQLQVHNGTTLTNVTSTHTPTTNVTYELRLFSDGTGNVTLFIDGTEVATTSAGPSSSVVSAGTGLAFEAENIGTVTGTKAQLQVSNFQVTIG